VAPHLGVEVPGRVKLVPHSERVVAQPRQVRAIFMHLSLPKIRSE
jgi:hypothetical protein